MKKSKILALGLILSIMLSGAGYAAWTDNITIRNTVATGEMRVEFVKQSATVDSVEFPRIKIKEARFTAAGVSPGGNTRYATAETIQDSPQLTTIKLNKIYPGIFVQFDSKFINRGTIPVVLKDGDIKVDFVNRSSALENNLIVYGGFSHYQKVGNSYVRNESYETDYFAGTLAELEGNLNNMLKGIRMEPGDYILFDLSDEAKPKLANLMKEKYNADQAVLDGILDNNCINFWLPLSTDDGLNTNGSYIQPTENQNEEFNIVLNFSQHNQ